jgi:hypothetical protein
MYLAADFSIPSLENSLAILRKERAKVSNPYPFGLSIRANPIVTITPEIAAIICANSSKRNREVSSVIFAILYFTMYHLRWRLPYILFGCRTNIETGIFCIPNTLAIANLCRPWPLNNISPSGPIFTIISR